MLLVGKNGDLVVKDCGYKVNNPKYKAKTEEAKDTNNEGNDVRGLKILENSVNGTHDVAEENLDKNSCNLGEIVILLGKRRRCHCYVLLLCFFGNLIIA